MSVAPVVLFVYNRPVHTRKTLECLMSNDLSLESELIIYADGPKIDATEDIKECINQTRQVLREKKWCKNVTIIERDTNYGLAKSIITGVTEVVNKYGRLIVLEDDIVTSKYFLQFMNDALEKYKDEDKVACLNGYVYPVNGKLTDTFFIRGSDCWGWATWKHAWDIFEKDGEKLLEELIDSKQESEFDFNNTYPYIQMLKDQIQGKNNSWAIRWYASAFLNNMYCLYPGVSLVQNIGIDGSGIHSGESTKFDVEISTVKIEVKKIAIEEDKNAKRLFSEYFISLKPKNISIFRRIINKLRTIKI